MDSLTQIVLGAAVGEVILGKRIGNKAMLYGAIAGTIPDLDVLARSFMDDLSATEVHRGVTHSLLFCIAMAPIFAIWVKKHVASFISVFTILVTLVFFQSPKPIGVFIGLIAAAGFIVFIAFRKAKVSQEITTKEWTMLFFWSLVTHPLLDCHTTWGTQFFWPFPVKIAFNNIFVADPFYTVPFLICVIAAMFYRRESAKRARINRWGIYISSAYMALTFYTKYKVHAAIEASLDRQGIEYRAISSRPSPLQTILWSANVEAEDSYYLCMHSLLDTKPEVDFARVMKNHDLLGKWKEHRNVGRLQELSQGQYVMSEKDGKLIFNDLRFGQIGEPSADKDFLFRYELIEKDGDLFVTLYKEPKVGEQPMRPLFMELYERIKGE